ncbi:MAG: hypothetical protein Q7U91_08325 [Sideroxyarcus sp.]|nr:hypothetical protein [Sideroxyarcus sp.]
MDEAAYQQKVSEMLDRPCTFEKAVLSGCVACLRVQRVQIAEREAVTCRSASCLSRCTALHELLRHNFSFALGLTHDNPVLPHAKEMRVQCGGLMGIQKILNDSTDVDNVDALLDSVLQQWGDLADIPYSEVVHAAALSYKGRHG